MKPIYWIHNVVYLPLLEGNKYVKATISGIILDLNQYTAEEIKTAQPNVQEVADLHDLVKAWGNKI